MVLDNLEDPGLLRAVTTEAGGVRLLVTTRRRDWPAGLGVHSRPLDTLPRAESLRLLRTLAPRLEKTPETELERLARQLFDLPLALHVAGSYLKRVTTLTPARYLEALEAAGGALKYQPLPEIDAGQPRPSTS